MERYDIDDDDDNICADCSRPDLEATGAYVSINGRDMKIRIFKNEDETYLVISYRIYLVKASSNTANYPFFHEISYLPDDTQELDFEPAHQVEFMKTINKIIASQTF